MWKRAKKRAKPDTTRMPKMLRHQESFNQREEQGKAGDSDPEGS